MDDFESVGPNTDSKLFDAGAEGADLAVAFEPVVGFAEEVEEEEENEEDCLLLETETSFGFGSFSLAGGAPENVENGGRRSRDGSRERSTSLPLERASFSLLNFGMEYEEEVEALA